MGMEEEIKEMEEMIAGDADTQSISEEDVQEVEEGDQPDEDPPVEEQKEEEEVKDEVEEGEVQADSPTTDAPAPDPYEEKFNDLQSKYDALLEKFESLNNRSNSQQSPTEDADEGEEQDFVGDTDPYDLFRDKEDLNKLLNAVYKKAVDDTKASSPDNLDNTITEKISAVLSLHKASEKFYVDNPELEPFKSAVSTVFGEVAKNNPNKSYQEVLALTADESRKRLKLKKGQDEKPPKLPRKKAQQRKTPDNKPKDPMQAEIEEMNKLLNL